MNRPGFVRTSPADLATTLGIVLFWGLVWFLWPSAEVAPAEQEQPVQTSSTRYVLCQVPKDPVARAPTLIALPSATGFSHALQSESEAGMERRLSAVRPDPSALLDRALRADTPQGAAQPEAVTAWPVRPVERYVPTPVELPVFPGLQAARPAISIQPSRTLRETGFALAGPPPAGWPETKAPWSVEAYVDLDTEGGVSHVFLNQPVSNETVNAAVTAALKMGHAEAASEPRGGAVTLSWPGKPR